MKYACYIVLLASGFWNFSCSPKSTGQLQQPEQAQTEVIEEEEESEPIVDTVITVIKEVVEEPIKIELVASFKKTPCYGKCPVFEVNIYSNGRVAYEGTQHVDKIGLFEAQVSEDWIADIYAYGTTLGYFKMKNHFPSREYTIPDLPNTITFLKYGEEENTITNNHNAPVGLTKFEAYFQKKLDALDWKAIIGQN